MSDPLARMVTRVAYMATQLPRLAWYAGHDYVYAASCATPPCGGTAQVRRRRASACRTNGGSIATSQTCWRRISPMSRPGSIRFRRSRRHVVHAPAPLAAVLRGPAGDPSPARAQGHARGDDRRDRGQASGLLPAELPLSIRRLAVRGLGRSLRHAGRGAVQGQRQCDAPPGAGAAARGLRRARSTPIAAASTSPAARAGFSTSSSRHGRGFRWSGSTCRRPMPARAQASARWSRVKCRRRQCRSGPGAGRELRRRDVHVHVSRAAAARAPQRRAGMRPRPQAGRPPGIARFAAARRTSPTTTECSNGFRRTITSRITAAISARIFPRSRGRAGSCTGAT